MAIISRVSPFLTFVFSAALLAPVAAVAQPESASPEQPEETEEETAKELDRVTVFGELGLYSALKSETPIMETARSVSIETEEEIRDKGALDLADTYLYSAGVYGDTFGFATRGDWVKVRGLDTPEYRDSLQALFGNYNNTRPHVYTLEQVEILKGPASVLYGQGSAGGLVNVVSKRPRPDHQNELVLQAGNDDYGQIAADIGGELNESGTLLYRVVGVFRDSETQVDFVGNRNEVLAPSLTWTPTARTSITLLGNFEEYEGDTGAQFVPIEGTLVPAPNGRFIDDSNYFGEPAFNRYDTSSEALTLLADHMINANLTLEVTARRTEGEADYHQAWPSFIGGNRYVFNDDGSLYRDGMVPRTFYESDARSEQTAMDARLRADFRTGDWKHEVMFGAHYQDVETENDFASAFALGYDPATGQPDDNFGDRFWINLFDPQYGDVPSDAVMDNFFVDNPPSTTRDQGIYLNDQLSLDNWRITAGLRYDEVESDNGSTVQEDDAVSSSLGVLYAFDNGLSPYVSYAESFDPVVGVDAVTGESLKPREGRQNELGIKYQPPGRRTQVTAAVFDIERSNLPNPSSMPNAPSQQEGVAEVQGVELEALTRFGPLTLEANASRIETQDPDGNRFASVPENQASAWLGYRPSRQGLRAGAGLRYVGESYDGSDDVVTPSYTLADLMVGYRSGPWDFSLNVRNAADKEYLATCLDREDCFFGERRTIVGSVAWRFD